jgi:hypothetical protein
MTPAATGCILPSSANTDREWNFRDDIGQHFFGDIPAHQLVISLTLDWKPDERSPAKLVGRYKIDMHLLEREKFAKKVARGVLLRFQRTGDFIEIAISATTRHLWSGENRRAFRLVAA